MTDWPSEIRAEFLNAGWQELSRAAVAEGQLHGLFVGAFAVCGVRVAESSFEVTDTWAALQASMAELKTEDLKDQPRDYYLIFIVNRVDDLSLRELQRVLDDTRVCRKICLERLGRSLGETLRDDIPFFSTPGTTSGAEPFVPDIPLDGVSESVQRDLELKSAERILEALVATHLKVNRAN
jgi:hypothetical protein